MKFSLSKNNFVAIQSKPQQNVGCYACQKVFKAAEVKDFIVELNQQKTAICPHCDADALILIMKLADRAKFNHLVKELDEVAQWKNGTLVANDDVELLTKNINHSRQVSSTITYALTKIRSSGPDQRRSLLKVEVSRVEKMFFQKDANAPKLSIY
jgi:hypothetical protein